MRLEGEAFVWFFFWREDARESFEGMMILGRETGGRRKESLREKETDFLGG